MKKIIIIVAALIMLAPMKMQAKTLINMGEFKITAYCPCESCSEGYGRLTSTRKIARSGRTIAVDPSVIGYGSVVRIGNNEYVAEDCGGLVRGDHIDVFVDTHDEVDEFGLKYRNVWIVDNR